MDLVDANAGAIDFRNGPLHVFVRDGLMTDVETEANMPSHRVEGILFGSPRPEPILEEIDGGRGFVEPAAWFRLDAKTNCASGFLFDAVQDRCRRDQVFHTAVQKIGGRVNSRKAQRQGRNAPLGIGRQQSGQNPRGGDGKIEPRRFGPARLIDVFLHARTVKVAVGEGVQRVTSQSASRQAVGETATFRVGLEELLDHGRSEP